MKFEGLSSSRHVTASTSVLLLLLLLLTKSTIAHADAVSELAALRANVADLQGEIETLKSSFAKLCADLGIAQPPRN